MVWRSLTQSRAARDRRVDGLSRRGSSVSTGMAAGHGACCSGRRPWPIWTHKSDSARWRSRARTEGCRSRRWRSRVRGICRSRTPRAISIAATAPSTPCGRSRSRATSRAATAARAPGRGRPDELTTAEALDLVDQMARLGVKEVTLIGGEAYLREDWLDLDPGARRPRDSRHDDLGRPRAHARDHRSREGRGAPRSQHLDRRRRGRPTTACAAWPARTARRSPRSVRSRRAASASRATRRSTGSRCRSSRASSRPSPPSASGDGRSSSPSRWGAPPTSPTCSSSRTTSSSSFRASPR